MRQSLGAMPNDTLASSAGVSYRDVAAGEEQAVSALTWRAFDQSVAPRFCAEGIDEFVGYVEPDRVAQPSAAGHIVILALDADQVVGMAERGEGARISLLLVDEGQQANGMGRWLASGAFRHCAAGAEGSVPVTAHAPPSLVGFCKTVGFRAEGPERTENGVCYVPMRAELAT
jgi:predicted GNAT family N-acyltransferase